MEKWVIILNIAILLLCSFFFLYILHICLLTYRALSDQFLIKNTDVRERSPPFHREKELYVFNGGEIINYPFDDEAQEPKLEEPKWEEP